MYGRTVVVVEDEPLVRMEAVDTLQDAGLKVVEFDNADDALDFVLEGPEEVAAVLTDVDLADGSNGLELARTVARRWVHIAVTVTSGKCDGRPSSLPKRIKYVPKPWRPLDLLAAVRCAVAH